MNKVKVVSLYVLLYTLLILIGVSSMARAETFLNWGTSTGMVEGYRVYYKDISGTYINYVDVGNVNKFSLDKILKDNDYECNTIYYFIVRAYNEFGESGNSTEVDYSTSEIKLNKMRVINITTQL